MAARHDERFLEYVDLFNERAFWDCHEVLEDLWLDTYDDSRQFYQGLIHFAVAFHHLWRRNMSGSQKLFTSSLGYLAPFGDQYLGLDLRPVRSAAREWLDRLRNRPDGAIVEYDDGRIPVLDHPACSA